MQPVGGLGTRLTLMQNTQTSSDCVAISVSAACRTCQSSGIVASGTKAIIRANPRSIIPGLLLISVTVIVLIATWIYYSLFIPAFGHTILEPGVHFLWGVISLLLGLALLRIIPLKALICSKCKRVVRWKIGFKRGIPLCWQKSIVPSFQCSSCGYDLHGLKAARCPECFSPFPEEWLKVTHFPGTSTGFKVNIV
jgi:hypothetical protein